MSNDKCDSCHTPKKTTAVVTPASSDTKQLALYLKKEQNEFNRLNEEYHKKITLIASSTQTYEDIHEEIYNFFDAFCKSIPIAVFLSSEEAPTEYVQCAHGGIEPGFDIRGFLESDKSHQSISQNYAGFNWSDFTGIIIDNSKKKEYHNTYPSKLWAPNTSRGIGYIADIPDTQYYLEHSTLKAFFRGHQDMEHSFKLVVEGNEDPVNWTNLSTMGSYHKPSVLMPSKPIPMLEFLEKTDTVPVFTCTTATESRSLPDEGFCHVTMARNFENWIISPFIYEPLSEKTSQTFWYIKTLITLKVASFTPVEEHLITFNEITGSINRPVFSTLPQTPTTNPHDLVAQAIAVIIANTAEQREQGHLIYQGYLNDVKHNRLAQENVIQLSILSLTYLHDKLTKLKDSLTHLKSQLQQLQQGVT